jgi:hypothetical protein
MLGRTREELEFRRDVLSATHGAHIEVLWVYEKTLCMYPSSKISFLNLYSLESLEMRR